MPSNVFGRGRYCVIRQKLCVMIAEALFLRSAARSASEELFFSFRSVLFQLQERSFSASKAFFFSFRSVLFQFQKRSFSASQHQKSGAVTRQTADCAFPSCMLSNEKYVRIYFEKKETRKYFEKKDTRKQKAVLTYE